jgi:hypothetical protein
MSYDLTARNNALDAMCEISLNGYTTKKLDFLGTIHIYGVHYFNVFRRYNSVYEIVIEDFHGDFHFHKDYTIRQSLQHILCLSNEQMEGIYTRHATSFKHGSCPMTSMHDAPNMHWSELQQQWQAAALDFGGILEEYHRSCEQIKNEVDPVLEGPLEAPLEAQDEHKQLEVVGTPCVLHAPLKIPYAPLQERKKPQQININLDSEAAEILLSFHKRGKSLSDRFKEVENKKRTWTQLSESESESDSEDDEQDQEDDEQDDEQEENEEDDQEESEDEQEESEEEQEEVKRKPSWCTVLRNGTTILRY